jgi:CRISPR-associated protein Cas1
MDDLHRLPRFEDSLGYLYVENARIDQLDQSIAVHDQDGLTPVPAAALAVLMLGPGTRITHAAVKALADNNCLAAWVGQEGVRMYAHSTGGTRSASLLLRQAALALDPDQRLAVVRRMYEKRFGGRLDPGLTLQQIRGKEGVRVREAYAKASLATNVPWQGRFYQRGNWSAADPVNRALSAGNACLYGLTHAAILSAGYSPAIGFIHTGKQLSFVYDVADFYKVELIVPAAFEVASTVLTDVERNMRIACRDRFGQSRLLGRIITDIQEVLNVEGRPVRIDESFDEDGAAPGALWDPDAGGQEGEGLEGGRNYGDPDS